MCPATLGKKALESLDTWLSDLGKNPAGSSGDNMPREGSDNKLRTVWP